MNNESFFRLCVDHTVICLYSRFLVGPARGVQFPVKVHTAATITFLRPQWQKEMLHSTSGVHGVSILALTLGIGFMCERAGFCVCLRTEIHQK